MVAGDVKYDLTSDKKRFTLALSRNQFVHAGLASVYFGASGAGIPASQVGRCQRLLDAVAAATKPDDTNLPGYGYKHSGRKHSVDVNGSSRISYEWRNGQATDIDYV